MQDRPTLPSDVAIEVAGESVPPDPDTVIGFAQVTLAEKWPINGLRHPPEGQSNGWYIWVGEQLSDAPNFFEPMCWEHLPDHLPQALEFLALPPGWRFFLAPDHEDVWFDENLLKLDSAK